MYVPRFNRMDDDEVRALVAAVGSAELITVDDAGLPQATRLPIVWDGDRLVLHLAIANPHWRTIAPGSPALAIVAGPEAYVSPTWYAAKADHGRVVPTWNYSAIHFRGHVTVQRSPDWLRAAVTSLTEQHEEPRPSPWRVTDAPDSFIEQQLKAIVGVDFVIDSIEAKAKRSQNRSDADRAGVIAGLAASHPALAEQMRADLDS